MASIEASRSWTHLLSKVDPVFPFLSYVQLHSITERENPSTSALNEQMWINLKCSLYSHQDASRIVHCTQAFHLQIIAQISRIYKVSRIIQLERPVQALTIISSKFKTDELIREYTFSCIFSGMCEKSKMLESMSTNLIDWACTLHTKTHALLKLADFLRIPCMIFMRIKEPHKLCIMPLKTKCDILCFYLSGDSICGEK